MSPTSLRVLLMLSGMIVTAASKHRSLLQYWPVRTLVLLRLMPITLQWPQILKPMSLMFLPMMDPSQPMLPHGLFPESVSLRCFRLMEEQEVRPRSVRGVLLTRLRAGLWEQCNLNTMFPMDWEERQPLRSSSKSEIYQSVQISSQSFQELRIMISMCLPMTASFQDPMQKIG